MANRGIPIDSESGHRPTVVEYTTPDLKNNKSVMHRDRGQYDTNRPARVNPPMPSAVKITNAIGALFNWSSH